MRRLSSTLSSGNVPRPWGTWAIPARTMASADESTIDWPANVTFPERWIVPEIARIVVVFPAPLAPSTTTISPSSTGKLELVEHVHRAVPGPQLRDLQQAHWCTIDVARRSLIDPGLVHQSSLRRRDADSLARQTRSLISDGPPSVALVHRAAPR